MYCKIYKKNNSIRGTPNPTKIMKFPSILAISLLNFSIAQAETFMGSTELSEKTYDSIIVLGTAKLTNIKTGSLTVTGTLLFNQLEVSDDVTVVGPIEEESTDLICKDLDVLGPVHAKRVQCVDINIVGSAKLEELQATGEVKLVGGTDIENATIKNLFLTAHEMKLKDVKVNDITIDKVPLSTQEQVLTLEGNTSVSGKITFKSGKGSLLIKDNAQIGKLEGGTIKEKKDQTK